MTKSIAEQAGEYKRQYLEKGITLSDAIIAIVALSNNLILVTDNVKHYPMPEINLQLIRTRGLG